MTNAKQLKPTHADHISGYDWTNKKGYNAIDEMLKNEVVVAQRKYDGERILMHFNHDEFYMTSRRKSKKNNDCYTEVQDNFPFYKKEIGLDYTVLDGELFADIPDGNEGFKNDWSTIVGIIHSLKDRALELQKNPDVHVKYAVFDCLFYNGKDIRDLPYFERVKYAIDVVHRWNNHTSSFMNDSTNSTIHMADVETFKFFINDKEVSENEYITSFIKEAMYEHRSTSVAKSIIKEDKETAKTDGKSTFIFESGCKFSIVCDSKVRDDENRHIDNSSMFFVKNTLVVNKDALYRIRDSYIEKGCEGIVIKSMNRKYYDTGAYIKAKRFETKDIVVYGFDYGNGKYSNTVGALKCGYYDEKTDSIIHITDVNCGTDKDRDEWLQGFKDGSRMNAVIEVKCQQITKTSLRHPVYVRYRKDKDYKMCTKDTIFENI